MTEMNDIRRKASRRLRSLLSVALSAAMLFGGTPALASDAGATAKATLNAETGVEVQTDATDATPQLNATVQPDVTASGAPMEQSGALDGQSDDRTAHPNATSADATAAPTASEAPAGSAAPAETAAPTAVSVEQQAVTAVFTLDNGYNYQIIKPGVDQNVNLLNRGGALPEGTVLELKATGLEVSPEKLTLTSSQAATFSVHADSDGVYTAKLTASDANGTVLYQRDLLLICASDVDNFAIPIICSDLVGKGIKKVDYVRADDPSTRLEVNSALMPEGYSATWSISTTSGEGNATIKLTRSGSIQKPPILYTKSNVANVNATVTLVVKLPGGEQLTRQIPVNYEVRAQVPTSFKYTGDIVVAQLGNVAPVDLTTGEAGSALTSGMTVTAELIGESDAQLTTTTFSPEAGLSIGATKPGIYQVLITAISDVPGVIDGAKFTKNVHLIVSDADNQLPDGLFTLNPAKLETTLYAESSSLGTVSIAYSSPVAGSSTYSTAWQVTDKDGNRVNIKADTTGNSHGNSAVLRPTGTLAAGEYVITATVNFRGAIKTLTAPLTVRTSAPRIDGLRSSYSVPQQYLSYVISAPGVVIEASEGVWEDYKGDVQWTCEPVNSASAAAFSSVTTDAATGYTIFKLPTTRVPGMYYFRFTAKLDDGRTASETVMLGIEDAAGVVPTPAPTLDPTQPRQGFVNAQRVNVRSGPSMDSTILGQLKRGDRLTVNDWTQEWFSFTYNGTKAYISGQYVTLDAVELPTSAPTPTPTPGQATPTAEPTTTNEPTPTAAPTATPDPAQPRQGVVNANRVNVRSGPGTNFSILGQVSLNDKLAIEDWSQEWYKFTFNGVTAYIKGEYVTLDPQATPTPGQATPTPSSEPVYGTVTLNNGTLRLRAEPDGNARVLTNMPKNSKVEILGETGSWYKVRYGNAIGYASKAYIVLNGTTPEATPTPTVRPTATPSAQVGTVTLSNPNSRLIVRSGPGTNYGEVTRLAHNTKVTVLGSEGDFYRIQYSGQTGYVAKQYVVLGGATSPTATPRPTSTPKPTATSTAKYATVIKSDGLALHETEQGATVRTIPNYGVVEVLHVYGSWTHVSYEGTVGYVESKYLKDGVIKPEGGTGTSAKVKLENSSAMYLRSAASQASTALTMIPNGATVTVITPGDPWCKISYNGHTGYCMAQYLQM